MRSGNGRPPSHHRLRVEERERPFFVICSLLIVGNGRILYDSFGMVMENTLSTELTGALLDVPDAATGLVHLGGGRWYDPALGRPLQPNPAGGPPTLPQALNRYAATPVGQPGVYAAAKESFLTDWTQNNWYRQGASASFACATCILSEIKVTQQLYRPRFTLGSRTFLSEDIFRKIENNTFENIENGNIWTEEQFLLGVFELDELEVRWIGSRQVDNILKRIMANTAGRIALNIGVSAIFDVGFETLEAATGTGRWANPYWTYDQKLRQGVVATGGDLFIVGALAWWNPSLWVAIPVYFVASAAWSYIHPVILPSQFVETRNLAPLRP